MAAELRAALAAELAALPPALAGCSPGAVAALVAHAFEEADYVRCGARRPRWQLRPGPARASGAPARGARPPAVSYRLPGCRVAV